MAAKIKLQRKGTKKRPVYRVVVQDESAAPSSAVIEVLGQYRTLTKDAEFVVDKERTLDWLKKGAQPTDKVRILLGKAGLMDVIDLSILSKRKPKEELKKEAEAAVAAKAEAKVAAKAEVKVEETPAA